jgi:hypothetical protein
MVHVASSAVLCHRNKMPGQLFVVADSVCCWLWLETGQPSFLHFVELLPLQIAAAAAVALLPRR